MKRYPKHTVIAHHSFILKLDQNTSTKWYIIVNLPFNLSLFRPILPQLLCISSAVKFFVIDQAVHFVNSKKRLTTIANVGYPIQSYSP